MIEQVGNAITFYAFYVASKVGKTGLADVAATVYVNGVYYDDGPAVEVAGGMYSYTVGGGDTVDVGEYIVIFHTDDATVDQKDLPALWIVGRAGIENLDAGVSTVPAGVWDHQITIATFPILVSMAARDLVAQLFNWFGLETSTLRELFRSLAAKDVTVAGDLSDTTYDPATDSLQALSEAIAGGTTGAGAVEYTLTVSVLGNAVDGAEAWVTTDEAGTNVVVNGTTNALGRVTFYLDPGSYWVWWQRSGYNPDNPTGIVVT